MPKKHSFRIFLGAPWAMWPLDFALCAFGSAGTQALCVTHDPHPSGKHVRSDAYTLILDRCVCVRLDKNVTNGEGDSRSKIPKI